MSDIRRIDKYTISVNGHSIRATPEQEARLLSMTDEQIVNFLAAMGATT